MKKDIKNLNKFTSDFIVSSRGQLDYPGMNTLIPNANGRITMKGVKNNVLGIDDLGNKKIMKPKREYQFPGNSVYEIPLKKKGGEFKKGLVSNPKKTKKSLASKKYSRSLSATNVLFTENSLFKKPKSRKNKVYDPKAKYYAEGGESCPNGQVWSKKDKRCIDLPIFGNSLNSEPFTKSTNLNNALDIKPLNSFSDFGKIKPKKIPVVEDSFLETLEKDINNFLDNPLKKAAQVSESLKEKGEDPSDALRHSTAGALTAQTIANKTGNIPFISNPLGYLGANIAGIGHELSTLSQAYLDDRPWSVKLQESLEDIYNNSAGANTIFSNNSEKDKINYLLKLTRTNQLPDGYGEERPFRNNPKWTDPYNQKQYGGVHKFVDGGSSSCSKDEVWDQYSKKCVKVYTLANDKKFIDGVGNWAMQSNNPDKISSEYNDQIKHYLYSGAYGYDPITGTLHKLPKEQKTVADAETKKILAKQNDKAAYTQSIIDAGFDPDTFGKSKGTNVITGEKIYGDKSQEDVDKINKEAINNFVTEGHKKAILDSPFNTAAFFTPSGIAAGVMQGAANLVPDTYDFGKDPSWSGAGAIAMDALMMSPTFKNVGKFLKVPKQLPGSPNASDNVQKAGFLNPLALIDKVTPRFPAIPTTFPLGMEDDVVNWSPLNLIPGYGKKLAEPGFAYPINSGNTEITAYRKFGNSLDDLINSKTFRPQGGFRMGADQIKNEGNWAEAGIANENYKGVFAAGMDPRVAGTNIQLQRWSKRNGVVGMTKQGNPAIPITDPGFELHRRLPWSNKYVPIDKQKLIDNKFQLATQLPHVQSLIEKYGIAAAYALTFGYLANGKEGAIENLKTVNKYSIDPIKNWSKTAWDELENTLNEKQYGGITKFDGGGEPENPPDKVKNLNEVTVYGNQEKRKLQGSLMDRLKQVKKAYNDHRVNLGLQKQKQSTEGTSSIISLKDQIQSYKKELNEEKKSYDKASKALNVLKKYNPESYKKAKVSDVLNSTGVDDLRNLYKEGKISDATFMDFYDNFGKSYDREATRTTEEDQLKLEDSWYGQPDEEGKTRWMGNPNNVAKVAQAIAIGAPLAAAAPIMAPVIGATLAVPEISGGLNAYFGYHGLKEFGNEDSHTRKSMSRAYDDPTGSNIGDAAWDVGMNSLNFVGLPFGKAFQGSKNVIKGFKGVPKELTGSPNSFELFDLNNVRKPSGSIGNQGATPESANKILQSLGIKVKGKIPNEVSLKEMVEHLKNNPKDASKYKKFLENEPINVSELPGGEYQINDGHHRATLSYYSGNENIPAIIKNKGEYITQLPGSPNLSINNDVVTELRNELSKEGIISQQKTLNLPWKEPIRKTVKPWNYELKEKIADIKTLFKDSKNPDYFDIDKAYEEYVTYQKSQGVQNFVTKEEYTDGIKNGLNKTRFMESQRDVINHRFNNRFAKKNVVEHSNPTGGVRRVGEKDVNANVDLVKNRWATWDMYLGKPQTQHPMYDISELTKSKKDVIYTIKENFIGKEEVGYALKDYIDDIESLENGQETFNQAVRRVAQNITKKGDSWIVPDSDVGFFGTMGGFHWKIEKMPDGNYKAIANDVWDLQPLKNQKIGKYNTLSGKILDKVIKPIKNIEVGKTLGIGKPLNVKVGFILDGKTKKIINTFGLAPVIGSGVALGATQYKQGGTTNDYVNDLTPEEIQKYIDGGYIVEEIN